MHLKKEARIRRAKKLRGKTRELGKTRLCVNRTPRHIYAQIINAENKVLASASTLETKVKESLKTFGNVAAATLIGELIAERAQALQVKEVVFDRSGFAYHGRVSALADAARNKGLQF